MAQSCKARRQFRLGLSAAFAGLAFGLAGSVSASDLILSNSPRCAAVANSPLAEPEWYASECVIGGGPAAIPELLRAPAPLVPGDLFYLHNIRAAGPFPQSVYTSPIPTYNFTLLGPNTNPIYAMDFDNTA